MGVSLERVQFKFASIIGELCSDPDVLSQFAVWLDLRLAEYKLKGAISLDCSGEEPNPLWLKGINKQLKGPTKKQVPSHRSSPGAGRTPPQSPYSHLPTPPSQNPADPSAQADQMSSLAERLSPDVVVVKEEPSDVYPVQMHVHQRKRSAAETISSDDWSGDMRASPSSPKHRRFSSTVHSPANQSLMSVIGGFSDDVQESGTEGDNSGVPAVSTASPTVTPVAMFQSDMSAEFSDGPFNTSHSTPDMDLTAQDLQHFRGESSQSRAANDRLLLGLPPKPKNTKRRKVLTLEERMKVIEMAEKMKKSSRKIASELGVGKSQIQMILKRRSEVFESFNNNVPADRKRHRVTGNENINQMVLLWLEAARSTGATITGPILQEKALEFAGDMGNTTFKASNGWLECFLKRHRLIIGKMRWATHSYSSLNSAVKVQPDDGLTPSVSSGQVTSLEASHDRGKASGDESNSDDGEDPTPSVSSCQDPSLEASHDGGMASVDIAGYESNSDDGDESSSTAEDGVNSEDGEDESSSDVDAEQFSVGDAESIPNHEALHTEYSKTSVTADRSSDHLPRSSMS